MGKCTTCGINFVQVPEQPALDRECKWCEIKRLRGRLARADALVKSIDLNYDLPDEAQGEIDAYRVEPEKLVFVERDHRIGSDRLIGARLALGHMRNRIGAKMREVKEGIAKADNRFRAGVNAMAIAADHALDDELEDLNSEEPLS